MSQSDADPRDPQPATHNPIICITGDGLALGPIPRGMLPLFQAWFNDLETLRTAGIGVRPWTIESVTAWYERVPSADDAAWFMIYELPDNHPIGFAGLRDIDFHARTAEYAITIGAATARGRGYGTSVTRLMLDYAFSQLGLDSVVLETVAYNHAAMHAYQKVGFREIGRRSGVEPMGGRLWDSVLMECVRDGAREGGDGRAAGPELPGTQPTGLMPDAASGNSFPVITMYGDLVALGPAERGHLPTYTRWFNDFQTMRTQGDPEPAPRTIEEITSWYESEMSGKPDRTWFSVYERESLRLIGFVDLHHIDHRNRRATMSLMVGEPDARGKGYGTEMARLIVDYGYRALNLRNIALEVYEYNAAGMRAYEKAGFREFARRHQAHQMGGRLWDIVLMEWTAEHEIPG